MKIINTTKAPKAIGPYSQALVNNGLVYTSGCLAIDLNTGMIEEKSIEAQATLVLNYLSEILLEAESSLSKVIKVTIYLKDLSDFSKVNKIYEDSFKDHKPVRSTVEVARLPKDALIEIDLIASL